MHKMSQGFVWLKFIQKIYIIKILFISYCYYRLGCIENVSI